MNRGDAKPAVAARVGELLTLVGLADQARKYPVQLSGGQQQRVALARALATSPGLLLLDEPLSALDARVRLRLRDEIKSLQRRLGVTTIMVTHDQEEALSMADRIVVMNHGVVEQVGSPQDIYLRPQTAFVADFVGRLTFLDGVKSGPRTVSVGGLSLDCADPAGLPAGAAVEVALRPRRSPSAATARATASPPASRTRSFSGPTPASACAPARTRASPSWRTSRPGRRRASTSSPARR